MPSGVAGRNDPCPCGSGKKYKKCCIGKEPVAPSPPRSKVSVAEMRHVAEEAQRLDELSNGALDAIEAKRYADAERLCEQVLREYPQMIDGHDRLGMLRGASRKRPTNMRRPWRSSSASPTGTARTWRAPSASAVTRPSHRSGRQRPGPALVNLPGSPAPCPRQRAREVTTALALDHLPSSPIRFAIPERCYQKLDEPVLV